ncbi:MAG: hypothetical protein KKB45_05550, partial [Gammaproteobacteria bacterium]|nr:hypothetical protein [Gammaproteobacteria bacterium]
VLQQLVQHQAPTQLIMGQLVSSHRRHGLPAPATLIALQQSPDPKLQAQLRRLKWWEQMQDIAQLQQAAALPE